MTDHPLDLRPHEVRAALDGRLSLIVRPLEPQPVNATTWTLDMHEGQERCRVFWYRPDGYRAQPMFSPLPFAIGDRLEVVQFRQIQFGDGKYAVGDDGHVYDVSGDSPVRRQIRLSHNGYEEITLRYNGSSRAYRINRLVAEAFLGPPNEGEVCRHLDSNRRNNRPENLDWGTPKQNSADAVAAGSFHGERGSQAKLCSDDVSAIRQSTETQSALADRYGVTQPTISRIRSGKRWATPNKSAPPRNRTLTHSRLTLTVKDVDVKRVQEVTVEQIGAVGVGMPPPDRIKRFWQDAIEHDFRDLWNTTHGLDAWDRNDWCAFYSVTGHDSEARHGSL